MSSPRSKWFLALFSVWAGAVYTWKRDYISGGTWLLVATSLAVELIIDAFKSEPTPPGRGRKIPRAVPVVWLLGGLVAALVLHRRL